MFEIMEPSEGPDTSLGHGMVISTGFIERYVVVAADHPSISKESPVGRSDYGALVVSAGLPTQPKKVEKINPLKKDEKEPPTQSSAVRKFLEDERKPQIPGSDINLAA